MDVVENVGEWHESRAFPSPEVFLCRRSFIDQGLFPRINPCVVRAIYIIVILIIVLHFKHHSP
ncbi:hypothetical protein HanPSC8_Chr02g0054231 [Helianthus annuus]|nr:hypothetical protein HanPSC8_Chr02g0054231 [Helianthus annuus]